MTIYDLAITLNQLGISTIPVKEKSKEPLVDWKIYQTQIPEKKDLTSWFEKNNYNIGIVAGKLSQLVVVDLDSTDAVNWAKKHLPPTPMSTITKKGIHLFYKYPANVNHINNKIKLKVDGKLLDLDIKADRGYVVGPLSIHESGFVYKMTEDWSRLNIDMLPSFDAQWFSQKTTQSNPEFKNETFILDPAILKKMNSLGQAVAGEGGDDLTFRVSCILVKDFGLSKGNALLYLEKWNEKNLPPWPIDDLERKIENAMNYGTGPIKKQVKLIFTSMSDLLKEPDEEIRWLWENTLSAIGTSILASKPKIGKTTLTRCLALAIASGEPFLNRKTAKGPVLYIAAEENRQQFKDALKKMNPLGAENLHLHFGPTPRKTMFEELDQLAKIIRPSLIIADTLFKVVSAKDGNSYAEMTTIFDPIHEISANHKCHILVNHHLGKTERDHSDGVLGSTALTGNVDSILLMDRKNGENTIKSVQRYGHNFEPHFLIFDEDSKNIFLGEEIETAQNGSHQKKILRLLADSGSLLESDIVERVTGSKPVIGTNLRLLLTSGEITRVGTGKRGSPYYYSINKKYQEPEKRGF